MAQICRNGHVITDAFELEGYKGSRFCGKCGASTLTECEACGSQIRGALRRGPVKFDQPLVHHCFNCGKPFPWMVATLKAASDLADDIEELSLDEREKLKATLSDLTVESPSTPVSVGRFRKLMAKAGPYASAGMRQIMVPVLVDAAKTLLEEFIKSN